MPGTSRRESRVPTYTARGPGIAASHAGAAVSGPSHSDGSTPFGTTALGPVGAMRSMISADTAATARPDAEMRRYASRYAGQ